MKLLVQALRLRPKPLRSATAIAAEVAHERTDADVTRALERTHTVRRLDIDGMPVITLTPRSTAPAGELGYIHGGAYVHPLVTPHWRIIEHLSRGRALRITVPSTPSLRNTPPPTRFPSCTPCTTR